jgi:AraC-like DNA-binding protein
MEVSKMAESRLIGGYPVIGIRPTIDGRRGPLKVRESLEDQTMNMAKSAAKLFEENIRYSNGEPVKVVIADTTIGRVAESAACAEKFRKEGVDITLSFAAEKMNFSESYFSRVFKRLMGINFVTYLNMIRVEHAAAELKASGKRVLDIALSSGFNNIRTFNRVFKEITGYTPSQFLNLDDPDSINLSYYKRKSTHQEFVEDDSLTLVRNDERSVFHEKTDPLPQTSHS